MINYRELTAPPLMRIIRSFDVNKPGTPLAKVKGGVCGGTLSRGMLIHLILKNTSKHLTIIIRSHSCWRAH